MRHDDAPATGILVEWAPFRLAAHADATQLLAASAAFQDDFLRHRPGFLHRELLEDGAGGWVDLVHWRDEAAAQAALEAAMASGACAGYFSLIEGSDAPDFGAAVRHYRVARRYASGTSAVPR